MEELPREREIPADRHDQLKARVLTAISDPHSHRRRVGGRRPMVAVATGLAVAAGAAFALTTGAGSDAPDTGGVYALGDNVLSEGARTAGRECLKGPKQANEDHRRNNMENFGTWPTWPANDPPTLLNHIEQPGGAAALVIYKTRSDLLYCMLFNPGSSDPTSREDTDDSKWVITAMGTLPVSQWLPGSVSIEIAGDSGSWAKSDYSYAAGRVSERVAQVVLDDGAGSRSTAKVAQGTFVVFNPTGNLIESRSSALVSYDTNGAEIDRLPALSPKEGRCYIGPDGKPVNPTTNHVLDSSYKSNKGQCKPAEQWSGRSVRIPTSR
jgi:hypothetical protein